MCTLVIYFHRCFWGYQGYTDMERTCRPKHDDDGKKLTTIGRSAVLTICLQATLVFGNLTLCKRQSYSIRCLDRPGGLQEAEAPRFQDNRHMKVVKLSALRTGRIYPQENIPGTHFCQRLSQPQGHSADRRNMSMKNSSDIIRNRNRDLPACSAVPEPTAPPRGPDAVQRVI